MGDGRRGGRALQGAVNRDGRRANNCVYCQFPGAWTSCPAVSRGRAAVNRQPMYTNYVYRHTAYRVTRCTALGVRLSHADSHSDSHRRYPGQRQSADSPRIQDVRPVRRLRLTPRSTPRGLGSPPCLARSTSVPHRTLTAGRLVLAVNMHSQHLTLSFASKIQ